MSLSPVDLHVPAARRGGVGVLLREVGHYAELSKLRLSLMVTLTTAAGFLMGASGAVDWPRLGLTVLGAGLAALGVNALNQCLEAERDARMLRTRGRPLPAGLLSHGNGVAFGLAATALGPLLLVGISAIAALLTLLCAAVYLLVYTPLKPRTPLNTLVGAVCGALPPMIGWAAATGGLGAGAWILAAILFLWQVPHFLALAWMYREDYRRGGFQMLPRFDASGRLTAGFSLAYALALVPTTLLLTYVGGAGQWFAVGGVLLAAGLAAVCVGFCMARTESAARRLFIASVVYLPLLLGLMVLDRPRADGALVHTCGEPASVAIAP